MISDETKLKIILEILRYKIRKLMQEHQISWEDAKHFVLDDLRKTL